MKTFDDLFAELTNKAASRPEGSRTVAELDAGVHEIGKKLVEEAAESWMAAEHEGAERAAEELSQLLYHARRNHPRRRLRASVTVGRQSAIRAFDYRRHRTPEKRQFP